MGQQLFVGISVSRIHTCPYVRAKGITNVGRPRQCKPEHPVSRGLIVAAIDSIRLVVVGTFLRLLVRKEFWKVEIRMRCGVVEVT